MLEEEDTTLGETHANDDGGGEFECQGRRKLRFLQRKRAIIFSGDIRDFTATSMAAAKLMKGKVRETRMTQNGELVVEVDSDEDAAVLRKLNSLGGVSVTARESKDHLQGSRLRRSPLHPGASNRRIPQEGRPNGGCSH